MKQFRHLVFAGTFDRLHIGHNKMLDLAFSLAEKVSIGITTNILIRKKILSQNIEKLEVRSKKLEDYIKKHNWLKRAKFFRIGDIYGSSITDKTMDSILVTELTKANAEKINKIRTRRYEIGDKRYLRPLKIIVAPLIRGEDGEVVTSERIRSGEIDREGKLYKLKVKSQKSKVLVLPRELRQELRKPLGKVFGGSVDQLSTTAEKMLQYINPSTSLRTSKFQQTMVISVGDVITESLFRVGFEPDIKIIDFRTRRKPINSKLETLNSKQYQNPNFKNSKHFGNLNLINSNLFSISDLEFRVSNQPGTINLNTSMIIQKAIKKFIFKKKKSLILVKGEEDLLALPAVLFAPLNSVVLYGQMDLGVVVVRVTEEKKKDVEEIVKKFKEKIN